jgi:citronellol/citronellal dehydrogenase
LAVQGAHVAGIYQTSQAQAEALVSEWSALGSRSAAFQADVTDAASIQPMVERILAEFGRIDILVNNAGGSRMGPLAKITTRAWDSSFDLNVRSAYFCTREAGQHMIAQRSGAIVNVSSNAGMHGVKGGAHYASAKAALQMFTTVTAAEWGRHGIRANCVAAGMIASERAAAAWEVAKLDTGNLTMIPLRRPGTPEEVANMIVFFASDAASYITGQTVAVNGGPSMSGIPDE